ncbi:MAG: hypothetical protein KF773_42875 [Deltaproteobacteria bacterium]|nr:hypothetical protein [Deltaproteobacteria bacterium]
MRWIVLASFLVGVVGCGGTPIPMHSGYKSEKEKPWKKAKSIKLDDKGEGKAGGDLSYATYKRARWFAVELPTHGELDVKLEVTPPGEAVNDDFDLGFEILDPHFRVLAKSDAEEGDGKGEMQKQKTLRDIDPGKYLIHLYLQSRVDTAEFGLKVAFRSTRAPDAKTNFPEQVEYVPTLAAINATDEAPKTAKKPEPWKPPPGWKPPVTPEKPVTPDKKPEKPTVTTVSARIVGVSVVSGGVQILIGRGTGSEPPAIDGMRATLKGIAGAFPISGCSDSTCNAVITKATTDQVKAAGGMVVLSP